MKAKVWLMKRKTGCHKKCPACKERNKHTAKTCAKCWHDLIEVKRAFSGKKASYAVRWIDPRTGKDRSEAVGSDLALARRRQGEREKELLTGEYMEIKSISFDDFVTEHLAQIENTVAEGSYGETRRALLQFKAACDPRNLQDITFIMLEDFRTARIKDGVSEATLNKTFRHLQAALNKAVKRNYLKRNPFTGNRGNLYVREAEPVPVIIEPDEFKAILKAVPTDRWRAIARIGYFAGLRLGEILALEPKHIDFKEKMIHVRNKDNHKTKSRKNRSVPMYGDIEKALEPLMADWLKRKHIFTTGELKKYTVINGSRDFGVYMDRGGLDFTFHNLRDTWITNLLQTGTDPKSVQVLAGHQSVQTTLKYYAGVRAKGLTDAIKRLEKFA